MTPDEFISEVWKIRKSMLRLAMSIIQTQADAEDAVQDAILTAWGKIGTLRNRAAFKSWMLRIVANTCRNELRRKRRILLSAEVRETELAVDEDRDRLWECVCTLDEKYRVPIVLHYYDGFSIKEIASLEQRPMGTIAARMRTARRLLSGQLNLKEDLK